MYFETLFKYECCACTACEHSCRVHAISLKPDEEGFLYPLIDKDKCINCGICRRVCPVEHPEYNNGQIPEVYAAKAKNIKQRKKSSSGGMFYVVATWIIHQGGIVYGATMDAQHQVKHIGVNNMDGLEMLRGSKYVQSDLRNIFVDIKDRLEEGRWCYFVGTGCQVAGLKAFLRKDYETLLTSDLVCHGVPSQWLFDQHIQYLETKYKGKVLEYQFRNNESWGGSEIFKLLTCNGKRKMYRFPSYSLSPYLYSFMNTMTCRRSCYDCKFACIPRQGDITLGDYWGIKESFPEMDTSAGVSLVLVNNVKGKQVIERIRCDCDLFESSLNEAVKYNGNLMRASEKHELRDILYSEIHEKGYSLIAETTLRMPHYWLFYIKCRLAEFKFMKKIIEWKNRTL